jgi:hypothetical protein
VGHIFKNLITKIFTKLNHTTLMTAWAEASAFAGEWEQVFGVAVSTFYSSKAKMWITAVKVFINNIENMRTPVTVHTLIDTVPDTFKFFVIICHQLMVISVFR